MTEYLETTHGTTSGQSALKDWDETGDWRITAGIFSSSTSSLARVNSPGIIQSR
jgi:hypothetical protein